MRRTVELVDHALPGRPALDAALSRAYLDLVANGEAPETFRLHRPDDVLAFSGLDAVRPGFAGAVAAARARGFAPVLRLAGGHAAVFHTGTIAFAWTIPAPDPRRGIAERFDAIAGLVAGALRRLGVDARVGEVPGEYCPGAHSVNARGAVKLMGVGQRVVRGAAHVGGVVVVSGSERVRDVLAPVYRALDLTFDPRTAGSVEDEIGPIAWDDVVQAVAAELRDRHDVVSSGARPVAAPLARALERARAYEARFQVGAAPPGEAAPGVAQAAKLTVEAS